MPHEHKGQIVFTNVYLKKIKYENKTNSKCVCVCVCVVSPLHIYICGLLLLNSTNSVCGSHTSCVCE